MEELGSLVEEVEEVFDDDVGGVGTTEGRGGTTEVGGASQTGLGSESHALRRRRGMLSKCKSLEGIF